MGNKEKIDNVVERLIEKGNCINTGEWQSLKMDVSMIELRDIHLEFEIPMLQEQLSEEIEPDLPWAEDHFQERDQNIIFSWYSTEH